MKNWWRNLDDGQRKALLLFVAVAIVLQLVVLALAYYQTTHGRIIVDFAKQEIKSGLSFREWLFDWLGPEDRYDSLSEELTLVGSVNNVAYRAILRLPRNNQSVKKFLADATPGHSKFRQGLETAVSRCAGDAVRRDYKVEGYPSIIVRTMSINNMNELCPLAQEYGYQWQGALEIAQCPDLPKDNFQQQSCEDKVRYAKY